MDDGLTVGDAIHELEAGLPSLDDLAPLSQPLIPALLAFAFRISSDPTPMGMETSENTLSSIAFGMSSITESSVKNSGNDRGVEEGENEEGLELNNSGISEQGDDSLVDNGGDEQSTGMTRALKRPRLAWTPQLHKRFVDVVTHLGLKNAVPKTIMHLMNVEGLSRENVASHLQKYRLYVKRMRGLSNGNHSPVPPQSFFVSSNGGRSHANGVPNGSHSSVGLPVRMPDPQSIMPMQMMGMAGHGHGYIRYNAAHAHHNDHYQQHVEQHQRNWQANLPNGYSKIR